MMDRHDGPTADTEQRISFLQISSLHLDIVSRLQTTLSLHQ